MPHTTRTVKQQTTWNSFTIVPRETIYKPITADLSAIRGESENIMTALFHFYEIVRTKRTVKREWLFCAVYDDKTAHEKLTELRTNNPDKQFTFDKVRQNHE